MAQRRITDVATQTRFGPALQRLADTYTDGDTDLTPAEVPARRGEPLAELE